MRLVSNDTGAERALPVALICLTIAWGGEPWIAPGLIAEAPATPPPAQDLRAEPAPASDSAARQSVAG